ncbi:MAG: hypothetical protein E6G60_01660 [Actinobacteria bacterium]|nr:MAG: hypothetical protein E6G60_01660 [Actinomycetota bacterium]
MSRVEAGVIVAALRSAGITAVAGAEAAYPSMTFTDGVPVFVSERDVLAARELLDSITAND